MTAPTFGLQFIRVNDQPQPILGANLSVIGIVGPCSTADEEAFPLNTPVLVYSNDGTTIAKLGSDGYIPDAIDAINDQLAEFEVAAQLVIVRTPYGTAPDANVKLQQTIAKIMGISYARTGIHALLSAPSTLYCTPRVIICPGYTGQMANSLDSLDVTQIGIGYIPNQQYQLNFEEGAEETNGANLVFPIAHAIADANGYIRASDVYIDTYGAWMTDDPVATLPAPDGSPIAGVAASGQIIFSQQPGVGATITLNGTVVTFVAVTPAPGATKSGATLSGGVDNTTDATGSITFAYNPSVGDTITLNGSEVTFVASGATGLECNIGATRAATLSNLQTMLNASADAEIAKCTYLVASNVLGITWDTIATAGTTGNLFTLACSVTSLQVQLGGNLQETMDNLLSFLQDHTDVNISLANYSMVQATLLIVYAAENAIGNSFTLATTTTGSTISGETLTGGIDAASTQQCLVDATIALGANPVCAELTGVLNQLIGHAVVESAGTSEVGDKNWRSTMNSQRLIPVSGGIKVIDPISGNVVVRPIAGRVAGLIVARDHATGYPFHSAANQPIQGVVGPSRTIEFNLTDGDVEGQSLLSANIGIVARGLVGVETAISSGGFIFIGTDNAGDDELWRFYNVMRGRDYIHLSLMPALRTYLGRQNIDRQTIVNILVTIQSFLNTLTARQQILGARVDFKGSLNSAEEIRAGRLTVGFSAEEPPVLRRITTMSARYRPAIDAMVQSLESQLNLSGTIVS